MLIFAYVSAIALYPPLGRQLAEREDAPGRVIEHDLNLLIRFGHELNHKLAARAARRARFAVGHDSQNLVDSLVARGQHIENRVALGANTER